MYDELHRPQFHFSPRHSWMNDPNGLVWYRGGGSVRLVSLAVHELDSAWPPAAGTGS